MWTWMIEAHGKWSSRENSQPPGTLSTGRVRWCSDKSVTFANLRPDDVVIARLSGGAGAYTCPARVVAHLGDYVTAHLWNEAAGRWNRNPLRLRPERIAQLPTRKKSPLPRR